MKKTIAVFSVVASTILIGTSILPSVQAHASTINSQVSQTIYPNIDFNNPVLDNSNSVHYIFGAEILAVVKLNNPLEYAQIPDSEIQAILEQDNLRQGGTYYKDLGNGNYRIYINSAIVKAIKLGYMSVAAGLIAASPLTAGLSAAVGTAVVGAISYIPDNRGAWFQFSRSQMTSFGQQ
ncbi:MAG: hypothetical protein LBT37_01400 [Lactobacillaceae bacterium]|jgi:hypothetical protein|nr:hypothetical protein [Lactobacillaceae bacterium]